MTEFCKVARYNRKYALRLLNGAPPKRLPPEKRKRRPKYSRGVVEVALVLPVGLLLGVFVPSALDLLKTEAPAFIPWAWGINGIFSVLAPILAVAFSMTWGIRALPSASPEHAQVPSV